MSVRGTLAVAVAVAVGVAVVAVPVLGAVGGIAPASDGASAVQANRTDDGAAGNVSFGVRIASFMQASSAAADSAVDAGMWAVRYNRSDGAERATVVRSRIDRLERRSERLRERMAALQTRYENGTIPRVAYVARASRLTAQLNALGEAINETGERARAVGVNVSQLDRLRTAVRNMSGREVAAVARDLGVGPPARAGPPADRGPDDTGPPADVGPSATVGDNRTGPPEDGGSERPVPAGDAGPSANATSGGTGRPTDSPRDSATVGGPAGRSDRSDATGTDTQTDGPAVPGSGGTGVDPTGR
ncbi:MAG: hypothetical protein ABEJ94_11050 [Halorientalis sp.]